MWDNKIQDSKLHLKMFNKSRIGQPSLSKNINSIQLMSKIDFNLFYVRKL